MLLLINKLFKKPLHPFNMQLEEGGKTYAECFYKGGKLNGIVKIHGENDNSVLELTYKEDIAVKGYSINKDGKKKALKKKQLDSWNKSGKIEGWKIGSLKD